MKHDYSGKGAPTPNDLAKGVVGGRVGRAAGGLAKRVIPKGQLKPIVTKGIEKAGSKGAEAAYDAAAERRRKTKQ